MRTLRYSKRAGFNNDIILHIDGDRKYSKKAFYFYNDLNLNAVIETIPENRQEFFVTDLLNKYNPGILVVTGHDSMIKKGQRLYSMDNYKNSRYFVNTVKKARKWKSSEEELVIFAGACESFYEALMAEGANFASSPGRIMINYVDPLIVASKVALTDKNCFVTMNEILPYLGDGANAVGGTVGRGKAWSFRQK